jgi:phosphotransferase system enzyme I (PtsP)
MLRKLREVMAQQISAQERLDKIAVLIASNMVAEVCSLYLRRRDSSLELFATEGLNPEAVHKTVMEASEGLVGLIATTAESLALSDAQAHPSFSYKPETGEELFHAFLGVPILRAGNTLGVLVVQNSAHRTYSDEEGEALQTTAMVIAEMLANGELEALASPGSTGMAVRRPLALRGSAVSDGVGLGHVVLHAPRVVVKNLVADDTDKEIARLEQAIDHMRTRVDSLVNQGEVAHAGEHRDVLETFRMFAYDRGWLRRLREAVAGGLTAEAAVEHVQSDARARLQRQNDPYLRDRLHDLDDLANRLLHQLTGEAFTLADGQLPENAILVARTMGPAALLDYERQRLRGLVLEEGGASSHVAVVAKALGIPCVGDVEGITGLVEPGDAIILDGNTGEVQVRPQPDIEASFGERARLRARRQEQYRALRDQAPVTKDGVAIELQMNAGLLVDMPNLAETGATGIGLFRTEILFMVAPSLPRATAQAELYGTALDIANGKPVTFRTLDIGGDKVLPYLRMAKEENPALGWRAIRIGLDRPALLRTQIRALFKAAAGRDLKVMLPLVASASEFDAAKALIERERKLLADNDKLAPRSFRLGVMLEVPSLLFDLEAILARADFISVGTNDLMQYLFAVDRDNARVARRFDPLAPAMLKAMQRIADAANAAGVPATVCGEMAGRPLEALALLALGFRSLSMSPASIGPVKAMLLALDAADAAAFLKGRLAETSGKASLRVALQTYAEKEGIPL